MATNLPDIGPAPVFFLDYAEERDIGSRAHQEDFAMFERLDPDSPLCRDLLFVLADGMGGLAGGGIASRVVVMAFVRAFKRLLTGGGREAAILQQAMQEANAALRRRKRHEAPELASMGCTLCCAWVRGDRLFFLSMGDSLLYLMRRNRLFRINEIHNHRSDMERLADKARLEGKDPQAILNSPSIISQGSRITSYINGEGIRQVHCPQSPMPLSPGDSILVASDGLLTLPAFHIARMLKTDSIYDRTAGRDVSRLIDHVIEQRSPRQDNVSAGLIRLVAEHKTYPLL